MYTIFQHLLRDYILAVKKNQKDLYTHIEQAFAYADNTDINTCLNHFESIDGEHGRIETRKYSVLPALYASYDISKNWPGLTSIARVVSTREIDNNTVYQTRYFISSLPPNAETIAKAYVLIGKLKINYIGF